ncbi:hypothetical protein COMNV_01307 [Commensalibacter sp. Nvir]|uniref:hypothetical protein n=1 Tax=Commensalibacter sp. Nvir TaxID=3069817 RepID=UPI002D2E1A97|nr:hypothetical protein COMNV_01307 [Commensalibacter sp. Nvir]
MKKLLLVGTLTFALSNAAYAQSNQITITKPLEESFIEYQKEVDARNQVFPNEQHEWGICGARPYNLLKELNKTKNIGPLGLKCFF